VFVAHDSLRKLMTEMIVPIAAIEEKTTITIRLVRQWLDSLSSS
jgi:hypothetical protein